MPVEMVTKVVVFDRDLYKPGHTVARWMGLLVKHFEEHAKREAPVRIGTLREGIDGDSRRVGNKQMEGLISSSAPHTMYVLRGTGFPVRGKKAGGRIYSTVGFRTRDPEDAYNLLWGSIDPVTHKFTNKRIPGVKRMQYKVRKKGQGYWMRFGPDEHGPKVIAHSVPGQDPNNFLLKAWRDTARTHSSLRGRGGVPAVLRF